jgi:superkiller protein 3
MSAPTAKRGAGEEEAERLLAAAKLNPNDGGPFRALGHHYARAGDAQRAARCFQRAVALDPDDAEAGVGVNERLCTRVPVARKAFVGWSARGGAVLIDVACFLQEALCDLLDVDGKESLELAVCKDAADKSPRAFWAFRRLGYLQVCYFSSSCFYSLYYWLKRSWQQHKLLVMMD